MSKRLGVRRPRREGAPRLHRIHSSGTGWWPSRASWLNALRGGGGGRGVRRLPPSLSARDIGSFDGRHRHIDPLCLHSPLSTVRQEIHPGFWAAPILTSRSSTLTQKAVRSLQCEPQEKRNTYLMGKHLKPDAQSGLVSDLTRVAFVASTKIKLLKPFISRDIRTNKGLVCAKFTNKVFWLCPSRLRFYCFGVNKSVDLRPPENCTSSWEEKNAFRLTTNA